MTLLLNTVALLLVVLALAYAVRTLLPAAWLARWTGKSPAAAACGGGCNGCGSAAPVRNANAKR